MNTDATILNNILTRWIPQYIYKELNTTTKSDLSQACKVGSTLKKSINVITSTGKKEISHDHISR